MIQSSLGLYCIDIQDIRKFWIVFFFFFLNDAHWDRLQPVSDIYVMY